MPKQTFTSSGTFTVPAGITSIVIECWGGGGGGGTSFGSNGAASGGGGGGYAKKTMTVTPGTNYTVTVGTGGSPQQNGNDSWFSTSATVLAKGGLKGNNAGTNESAAGALPQSGNIGDLTYEGGYSNNGRAYDGTDGYGGGGGGAASSVGIGFFPNNTFPIGFYGRPGRDLNGNGPGGGSGGSGAADLFSYGIYQSSTSGVGFGGGGGGGIDSIGVFDSGSSGGDGGVVVTYGSDVNSNFSLFF